jgi:hypothetical protein
VESGEQTAFRTVDELIAFIARFAGLPSNDPAPALSTPQL